MSSLLNIPCQLQINWTYYLLLKHEIGVTAYQITVSIHRTDYKHDITMKLNSHPSRSKFLVLLTCYCILVI